MKRKGMQEILNATKPEDIFTMDLEIIEKEKEEYLSKYKPEEYKAVENSCITKKILMLYRKAVSILEGIESTQENYTNINFDTNYKLAEEILDSSQKISSEIMNISNKDDKNNILEEYYMLQREIMQFEDKLIEMNAIKKAYERMCLEKQDEIEMTDNDIRMIIKFFEEPEELEKFKTIIKAEKCNPMTYILNRIHEGGLVIVPADEGRISIRIGYTKIWLVLNTKYINDKYYYLEDEDIIAIFKHSDTDKFILSINKYDFLCENYLDNPTYIKEGSETYNKYIAEIFEYVWNNEYRINVKKWESMERDERDKVTKNVKKRVKERAKLLIPRKIDKEIAKELIQIFWKLIQEKYPVMSSNEEYDVCQFKSFLTSINMDIKMNNLRNLHSELRNAVRRYKLIM